MNARQRKRLRDAKWQTAHDTLVQDLHQYELTNGRRITTGLNSYVPSLTGYDTGTRRVTAEVDLPGAPRANIASLWRPQIKTWVSRR